MKVNFLSNTKGFSLTELLVGAAIMSVVTLGGYQAYIYFKKSTMKEAKKMDALSEFNAMTKDLVRFTEGAGISIFYLNFPIKTKSCNDTEPCIRQLENQAFISPTTPLPEALNSNDCIQFYRDSKSTLDSKIAFPTRNKNFKDKVWEFGELDLSQSGDLYATWTLKDLNSPPFMMVKSRDSSLYLSMLAGAVRKGLSDFGSSHPNFRYAFFEGFGDKGTIKSLVGYPFLIYNSLYTNQFTIQYASELVSCEDNEAECRSKLNEVDPSKLSPSKNHAEISLNLDSTFPAKVYMIKFMEMDFTQPFFSEIVTRQNLSSSCKSKWGNGLQNEAGYFFPSTAMSVSKDPDDETSNLNTNPLNIFYLNKYFYSKTDKADKGTYVALPIDIVTYRVESSVNSGNLQLISQLWHHTETKKNIKIHNLTSPLIMTRKLGTPDMGIWYNPLKKN